MDGEIEAAAGIVYACEINTASANHFMQLLTELPRALELQQVRVYINSFGGGVEEAIGCYQFMRQSPCKITTVNIGTTQSGANVIFLAGETRIANPHSTFIFHSSTWTPPAGPAGAGVLASWSEAVLRNNKRFAAIFRDRANIPDTEMPSLFDVETAKNPTWAVDRGFATEIGQVAVPQNCAVVTAG